MAYVNRNAYKDPICNISFLELTKLNIQAHSCEASYTGGIGRTWKIVPEDLIYPFSRRMYGACGLLMMRANNMLGPCSKRSLTISLLNSPYINCCASYPIAIGLATGKDKNYYANLAISNHSPWLLAQLRQYLYGDLVHSLAALNNSRKYSNTCK